MDSDARILVVDDDPDTLNGTARLLEKAGFTVDRAAGGEEALQAVARHHPHLVLLDRELPDIDGLEVCRRIKQQPAAGDVLVVMVSASYADTEDQAAGLERGADGYIGRPITNRELLARVRSWVRIQRLTRSLRLQNETLARKNEQAREAELASLNLMEDAIAARTRAENALGALQASEDELATTAALLESTGAIAKVGGWSVDLRTNRLFWSRETYLLHEVDPASAEPDVDEAINFYAVEARPQVQAAIQAGIDHGTPFDLQVPFVTATGRRLWVRSQGSAVRENGKTVKLIGSFQDISDSREAQRVMAENEERLRLALDASNQGIFDLNVQTGEATVSPRYATMLGYDFQHFHETQQSWIDRLHPDDREVTVSTLRGYLDGRVPQYRVEFRQRTQTGEWRWIRSVGRLIERDAVGRPLRMLGTHTDITERKRAEETAHQLALMMDAAPNAITVHDFDGRFLYANERTFALHGYDRDEFMALSLRQLDVPASEQLLEERMQTLRARGEAFFEVEHFRKDGTILPLEVAVKLATWDGTAVILSVATDITDRKRAQAELERSEEHNRAIARSAHDAIVSADSGGSIIGWNHGAESIFGFSEAEAIGLPLTRLMPEQYRVAHEQGVRRVTQGGAPRVIGTTVELEGWRKDGSAFPLELSLSRWEAAGRWFVTGIIRDISARKRAERDREALQAQLTQAQKIESVGRLAGGVAHDFNNMLSAILGFSELAILQLDPAHVVAPYLEEIKKAAQRSANLTRQLLAFARKQTIAPQVLDLNASIADILKMLRRLVREDVRLAWTPGSDLWSVKADAAQLDQILANLVVNANDAMVNRDGLLEISTSNLALGADFVSTHPGAREGEFVVLSVGDNGTGMDAATLTRIYEPFFTTKATGAGTGLGLAMVYGIMKQHGGYIDVASTVGKGTTFFLYFPRAADPATAPTVPDRALRLGGETILVAEDEPAVRGALIAALKRLGYTVLDAPGGAEALAVAAGHPGPIHALLTDVIMPGMNGAELRDALVARYPTLKVLFMSGFSGDVISTQGVLDSGNHFLQKPFTMRALAAAVRTVLESDEQQ